MEISKQSNMWNLLSSAYDAQKKDNITGYSNQNSGNSIFGVDSAQEVQNASLNGIFGTSQNTPIVDSFSKSDMLSKIQDFANTFANTFDGNLENLGDAMYDAKILSTEEKMGYDVLVKYNPSLDSAQTQNLLQHANLSKDTINLLNNVDTKIGAVRYFGNF